MKAIIITALIYLATLIPVHAAGFGWYVSSFDWNKFTKQLKVLEDLQPDGEKNKLAGQIVNELTHQYERIPPSQKFSFLVINESPMNGLEFYWEDAFWYAEEEIAKQETLANYFDRFTTMKSSISIPQQVINNYSDIDTPAFFIVSPAEILEFYNQLKELSSNTIYPNDYEPYLLHLEGVLLKNSVNGERGLVFFGHD